MGLLYTRMKVFHFKDKLDSLPEDTAEIQAPLEVRLKPTNFCNHRCWYCSYRMKSVQLGKDMVEADFIPEQKMYEIIDDMAEIGVKSVIFSGGGEPLCYEYIVPTVERLAKSGIKLSAGNITGR